VVEKLENIKEEVEELSYILKSDLKQDKTDLELDELMAKLKNIEKSILEALKNINMLCKKSPLLYNKSESQ